MRAIVAKELRENVRLLPIGLLLIGACLWIVIPLDLEGFAGDAGLSRTLVGIAPLGAGAFALVLGFAQSWFDFGSQQRGFLFHRAVSRRTILYGKVIAAAILFSIAVAIPFGCAALWFAWNYPDYIPVRPAKVLPSLMMCAACFVLHPAVLVSIEREARWFGTRLLPLIATGGSLFWFYACTYGGYGTPWYAAALIFMTVFSVLVFLCVEHSGSRNWILTFGAIAAVSIAAIFIVTVEESYSRRRAEPFNFRMAIDGDGNPWIYRYRNSQPRSGELQREEFLSGDRLIANKTPDLAGVLPSDFAPISMNLGMVRPSQRSFDQIEEISGSWYFHDSSGDVLVYDRQQSPPLLGFVTRSGFHRLGEASGPPFSSDPIANGRSVSRALPLWADEHGIYQFEGSTRMVSTLIDMPINSAITMPSARALVESGGKLHLFEFVDEEGTTEWVRQREPAQQFVWPLPKLIALDLETYAKFPDPLTAGSQVAVTKSGKLILLNFTGTIASIESSENAQWTAEKFIPPKYQSPWSPPNSLGFLPPIVLVVPTLIVYLATSGAGASLADLLISTQPEVLFGPGLIAVLSIVVSSVLTALACRRRGLPTTATFAWCVAAFLFGLACPIAVLAVYRRLTYSVCPSCAKTRLCDANIAKPNGKAFNRKESKFSTSIPLKLCKQSYETS